LPLYRKPIDDDPLDDLIRGRWIEKEEFDSTSDINVIAPNLSWFLNLLKTNRR
jgi:hypothetical protein